MSSILSRLLCILIMLGHLSSCTSSPSLQQRAIKQRHEDILKREGEALSRPNVVVQVCLPRKRIYYDTIELDRVDNHPIFTKYSESELNFAPKTIRRVATPDDPRVINEPMSTRTLWIGFTSVERQNNNFSSLGSTLAIENSTIADQPIYQINLLPPAKSYVGLEVNLQLENKDTMHYWFKLPKTVSISEFSDWFAPVSMETDRQAHETYSIFSELLRSHDMPIYTVSDDPPKMRVRLMQIDKHENSSVDYLPALTSAKKKFQTPDSNMGFFYEFVPPSTELVPRCN
ncbi:MAG: hypothetical protein ABUS47_01885 [Steroidobacter sp.]